MSKNNLNSLFADFCARLERKRIRQMMRGYRNLKSANRIGSIAFIKQDLTVNKLNLHKNYFIKLVMGESYLYGELVIRQYLLIHIAGIKMNKALLMSAGKPHSKLVYAMPSGWYDILEKYGFKVDRLRSTLIWNIYILTFYLYGLINILKIALNFFKKKGINSKKYVYFNDLSPDNLPIGSEKNNSKNIINWYRQWKGKTVGINSIHHSVSKSKIERIEKYDLIYQPKVMPNLSSISEFLSFILWAILSCLIVLFDLLRGRWWHTLILSQAAVAAQARIVSSKLLAKEYFFHNSNWIYRPLWTYEVERIGSIIYFYFYSTNIKPFSNIDKCLPSPFGWRATNWPCYLVWDEFQKKFIQEETGNNPKIITVGEIWFDDNKNKKINFQNKNTIAVFDVQPHRSSKYCLLALNFDYYIPQVSLQFIDDIRSVLEELEIDMALKRKRDIGNLSHPIYRSMIKKMKMKSNFIDIPASISPYRVIENSLAVISMPYTSTAILAVNQGKPSAYYDPYGMIPRDNSISHGIELLIGKDELFSWVKNILEQRKSIA